LPPERGLFNDLFPEGGVYVLPPERGLLNDLPPEGGLVRLRLNMDVDPSLTPEERKRPVLGAPIPANVLP
jgi:hypothetical protein